MRLTVARAGAVILAGMMAVGSCSSPSEGPDPSQPASVLVDPATALLVSIGDTVELTATVRDAASQPVAAPLTWTAVPAGVVTVDTDGRVVALVNGEATVTASAGAVSGSAIVTVAQVIDSVVATGDAQAADVGTPLDSAVAVTLLDARGNPVAGAPVVFTVVSGDGGASPPSATSAADGSASTTWTLGASAGLQELDLEAGFAGEASHRFTANGYALEADSIALYGGDGQSELALTDLAAPLQVQVLDSLGNGVADVLITFEVDGDATLDAVEVYTDLDGVASVGLTLGSVLGAYTASAAVPDSLTVTGLPLAGSPVTFMAEAVPYSVTPVTQLVVGDTVTITGSGFHPTLASNAVLVGGAAVAILGGDQSALTIEIPGFGCTPRRGMALDVSRAGEQVVQQVTVTPAGALALAVGEQRIVTEEEAFCLQFLPASNDEYLVGLSSTSWFEGGATFSISALDSVGPFPTAPAVSTAIAAPGADLALEMPSAWGASDEEAGLRAFERALVEELEGSGTTRRDLFVASLASPAGAPPMEEDVLDLRLPDLRGDACLDYLPITATVFSVGARLALATSATLPGPQDPSIIPLLDAANTLHAAFGDTGIDLIMGFLGVPAGWDADSRVIVVMVPEVSLMGVPAFASAVDQLPRAVCPTSDEGHYVYVAIPNAATTAQLAATLAAAPRDLAHHIAHVVQWTRRLSTGGNLLPSWVAEGQAEVVVEHVGLVLSGLGSQQDLGSAVLGFPGLASWIQPRFDRLARFQGWNGATSKVAGAPEGCSLFGFGGAASPCGPEAAPGAAWSFLRYLGDRFGPGAAGGEPGLQSAIIDVAPTLEFVAQLEAMLGVELADLVVEWAAMLYADGRLTPAQAPALQLSSWKLDQMIPAGPRRLAPTPFGFGDFVRNGSLVGGGTAYSLVTSTGAHGSLAVRVHDGLGGPLPSVLRPRLWVLRMR